MSGYRPLDSHWLLRAEAWLRPPAACAWAGAAAVALRPPAAVRCLGRGVAGRGPARAIYPSPLLTMPPQQTNCATVPPGDLVPEKRPVFLPCPLSSSHK